MKEKEFDKYFNDVIFGLFDNPIIDDLYSKGKVDESFKQHLTDLKKKSIEAFEWFDEKCTKDANVKEFFNEGVSKLLECKESLDDITADLNDLLSNDEEVATDELQQLTDNITDVSNNFYEKCEGLQNFLEEYVKNPPEEDVKVEKGEYFPDSEFASNFGLQTLSPQQMKRMPLFEHEPQGSDIRQSDNIACYFLAGLHSLASNHPERIKDMMRDNGDGTVTVKFYPCEGSADKQKPGIKNEMLVTVDKTLPNLDTGSANWVRILEKALAASRLVTSAGYEPDKDSYHSKDKIDLETHLGGAQPLIGMSVLDPTFNGSIYDRDYVSNMLKSLNDREDALKALEMKALNAYKNNNVISLCNPGHVIDVTKVYKDNGNVYLDYYDQQSRYESKVSLRDAFIRGHYQALMFYDVAPDKKAHEATYVTFKDILDEIKEHRKDSNYVVPEETKNWVKDLALGKGEPPLRLMTQAEVSRYVKYDYDKTTELDLREKAKNNGEHREKIEFPPLFTPVFDNEEIKEEAKEESQPEIKEEVQEESQPDDDFVSHETYPLSSDNDIETQLRDEITRYDSFHYVPKPKDALTARDNLSKLSKERIYAGSRSAADREYKEANNDNQRNYPLFNNHRIDALTGEDKEQLDKDIEDASKEYGISKEAFIGVIKTIQAKTANEFRRQLEINEPAEKYEFEGYDKAIKKIGEGLLCKKMLIDHGSIDNETEVDVENFSVYESYLVDPKMSDMLQNMLGDKKISDLTWNEYSKLEKDTLDVLRGFDETQGEELSNLSDTRDFLKYYAAKQENRLELKVENDEVVDARLNWEAGNVDDNAQNVAFEELEKIVQGSKLLQSYLSNPFPDTFDGTAENAIKTFKNHEKTLIGKIGSFYDNLSDDNKLEIQTEAEKLTKGHEYLSGADVMNYFIHKQYDDILAYKSVVDPLRQDEKFTGFSFAPSTWNSIKRHIGAKYLNAELTKDVQNVPQQENEEPQQVIEDEKVNIPVENLVQEQNNEPQVEEIQNNNPQVEEIQNNEPQVEEIQNNNPQVNEIQNNEPQFEFEFPPIREYEPEPELPYIPKGSKIETLSTTQQLQFYGEIVRLADRTVKQDSKKHKNSDAYTKLRENLLSVKNAVDDANQTGSYDGLNFSKTMSDLIGSANQYLSDHADDKKTLFNTIGKARQERIKTCARIKAMEILANTGTPYGSKDGAKVMLATKLICAEHLAKGFKGFKELCQEGAIASAINDKMNNPSFQKMADKVLEDTSRKAYDSIVKMSGSKCLKVCNEMIKEMQKSENIKNQAKEADANALGN